MGTACNGNKKRTQETDTETLIQKQVDTETRNRNGNTWNMGVQVQSNPKQCVKHLKLGVYPLCFASSWNGNWLHAGSIPVTSTKIKIKTCFNKHNSKKVIKKNFLLYLTCEKLNIKNNKEEKKLKNNKKWKFFVIFNNVKIKRTLTLWKLNKMHLWGNW